MPSFEIQKQGEELVAAVTRRVLPRQRLLQTLKQRYSTLQTTDRAFRQRVAWALDHRHTTGGGYAAWVAGVNRLREMYWGSFWAVVLIGLLGGSIPEVSLMRVRF